MKLFNRKPQGDLSKDDEAAVDSILNLPVLSEEMIRRDNFFHTCWVRLKLERRDLGEAMDRVELMVAGYDPDRDKKKKEEKKDPMKEGVPL